MSADKHYRRITCEACANAPQSERRFCHECRGVGYIERFTKPENCTGSRPEGPLEFEPMVGGWMCGRCGRSGPL